jgi:hypothetical protein
MEFFARAEKSEAAEINGRIGCPLLACLGKGLSSRENNLQRSTDSHGIMEVNEGRCAGIEAGKLLYGFGEREVCYLLAKEGIYRRNMS